ncbi:Wzz/FepE/Etk N-terminal domain-containing protein [Plesiomonas shigelloides]|uniref:Wzz/FepE/Etk N-terminal domain-containing protein n=1 Tax=Plesiomonas shigelloides TaxID=703 RepID=UPI000ECD606F|nr:Wzz/FepE/Etk N-terminal domain-containing protein [Plesiomonas shigelloides]KAB7693196.1 polysaccharide chain length modulation protein [Plesiomonas shigelloides]MDT1012731.1 Wzz/FepE/Etk N-terminal domain-containing protein [Plesiomonas shigelloides]QIY08916.1 polysaccharide chain length modulation protein [Plesiomonas shigelloides]HAD40911.1 polysaccharide chain length modulation protein [Plesiomonas shigelloides]
MIKQVSEQTHSTVDNELDIRGLFRILWSGKAWIIGTGVLFAALALVYSYVVKEEWSANAMTDRPLTTQLGSYFAQQQFLRGLDVQDTANVTLPPVQDEAYDELRMQLGSYDTRRDFWLQTDYYRSRTEGNARADGQLLDDLINDITFTAKDDKKTPFDSIRLSAETAADASNLLKQYIAFANARAVAALDANLAGRWASRLQSVKALVSRQESVNKALLQREQDGKTTADEALQAANFDVDYAQNKAVLAALAIAPKLDQNIQTFRYLRTPVEPVNRDKPRRLFLLILWGVIGGMTGAGIAIGRRIAAR